MFDTEHVRGSFVLSCPPRLLDVMRAATPVDASALDPLVRRIAEHVFGELGASLAQAPGGCLFNVCLLASHRDPLVARHCVLVAQRLLLW